MIFAIKYKNGTFDVNLTTSEMLIEHLYLLYRQIQQSCYCLISGPTERKKFSKYIYYKHNRETEREIL